MVYIYMDMGQYLYYRYIFSGMNIHLPAILMFTRGTRFWHTAIYTAIYIILYIYIYIMIYLHLMNENWNDRSQLSVAISMGKSIGIGSLPFWEENAHTHMYMYVYPNVFGIPSHFVRVHYHHKRESSFETYVFPLKDMTNLSRFERILPQQKSASAYNLPAMVKSWYTSHHCKDSHY